MTTDELLSKMREQDQQDQNNRFRRLLNDSLGYSGNSDGSISRVVETRGLPREEVQRLTS